ncbi:hypothetical protein WJX74_010566 [Apatococcus lobatus]|uniref:Uncharacterized protein n=1 Tax=Apatococcus lobatus TaxID=904363 RepID=A0AAW1R1B7_9CHLO
MDRIVQSRLKRFAAKPLEFWPFQRALATDERAVRAARGLVYIGLAQAYQARSWKAGMWLFVGAGLLLLVLGKPSGIRLDDESLKSTPNPAGNAPVGDLSGRDPDVPATPPSLTMTEFVDRMQNPIRTEDYAILPVPAPNQAHQVFAGVTPTSELPAPRASTHLEYLPRT